MRDVRTHGTDFNVWLSVGQGGRPRMDPFSRGLFAGEAAVYDAVGERMCRRIYAVEWSTQMQYSVGNVGRVVVARLFEGEELHACVDQIARQT